MLSRVDILCAVIFGTLVWNSGPQSYITNKEINTRILLVRGNQGMSQKAPWSHKIAHIESQKLFSLIKLTLALSNTPK
jgi:hypothetical protein